MNEVIKKLTELQVIDLEIAQLDGKMAAAREELDRHRQAYQERQDSMAELGEKIAAIDVRRRDLEAELADEMGRIKERQSKMMQVQTNREYQSLLKEIEDAKRANKEREEEIVHLMEQKESLETILAEQSSRCEGEDKEIAKEERSVKSLINKLTSEKAAINKKRTARSKGFKEPLLKKYDMLRSRRNGRAVVGVTDGVCQGCFMSIPPQQYNEVLKGDKMLFCPTCQRILYHQPEQEEDQQAAAK